MTPVVGLEIARSGNDLELDVRKRAGEPLGVEVSSALFDRVRTCDNHCEFCFIYQLPKGLRRSLYLKDDDYRLSFLYGNFTTLTRFTEADLERVVTERLSPLHVSIHSTDPDLRARMLRNPRGATSLRWLRALLDHGIEVRGQLVICPGVNDGQELDDTLAGILDRYPELSSVAVVPLGVSRFNREAAMRPHTPAEAAAVVDTVEDWQEVYRAALGRRLVHAADEYYLMAGRPFPSAEAYEEFTMHEDGIGMARTFELEFNGRAPRHHRCAAAGSSPPPTPAGAWRCRRTRRRTPGCAPARRRATRRLCARVGRRRSRSSPASSEPASSARSSPSRRRRSRHPGRQRVLRRQHRRHRADDRRRSHPCALRPSRTVTATCCPTSASPTTAASSTGRPSPTCPGRSRSSPPTARPAPSA